MSIEETIQEATRKAVAQALEQHRDDRITAVLSKLADRDASSEIALWKPYKASEVAEIIGLSRSRVYDIPEDELKPTWLGPQKGAKRFLGINVLCYITGMEPVDAQKIGRQVREAFLSRARQTHNVKPLNASGKRRVL